MQIDLIPISEAVPYSKNPRKNDKAVDIVAKSIKEFGFKVPIILDKNNIIVAGHTRLKAAQKLGLKEVPVIWADDLNEEQIKAFRIMDNKSTEYAKWDFDLLKNEIEELKTLGTDLSLTGLREIEISRMFEPEEEPTKGNKTPKYQIQIGDIYQMGSHKIICGDSTKSETYEKLLGSERVDLVYTDPPYGVSYKGTNNENGRAWKIIDGDNLRGDALYQMLFKCFEQCNKYLNPKKAMYVFHASANQIIFEQALLNAGFKVRQQLIWQKHLVLGHAHYHWAHEPMFYVSRVDEEAEFYGDRKDKTIVAQINPNNMTREELINFVEAIKEQSTIWEFKKDNTNEYIHPTQKPSKMAERAIINSSKQFETVLDPFGGSGSCLIACENKNRNARIIELDPSFVSHIIERWENYTGRKAVKQ